MSFVETELPQPRLTPTSFIGAASPLWAYFGAATAGGLAYWWMTQWARPAGWQALFDAAGTMVPDVETVEEALAEPAIVAMQGELETLPPVGGESAPVSPLMAEPESPVVPTLEAVEEAAEPAANQPAPVKLKKSPPPALN